MWNKTQANAGERKAKQEALDEAERKEKEILERRAGRVEKAQGSGGKESDKFWRCLDCQTVFQTHIHAMDKHLEDHDQNNFIKIAKHKVKGWLRNIYHEDNQHPQKTDFGNQTALHEVRVPPNLKCENEWLHCRKCGEKRTQFRNDMRTQQQALCARGLLKREKVCKGE